MTRWSDRYEYEIVSNDKLAREKGNCKHIRIEANLQGLNERREIEFFCIKAFGKMSSAIQRTKGIAESLKEILLGNALVQTHTATVSSNRMKLRDCERITVVNIENMENFSIFSMPLLAIDWIVNASFVMNPCLHWYTRVFGSEELSRVRANERSCEMWRDRQCMSFSFWPFPSFNSISFDGSLDLTVWVLYRSCDISFSELFTFHLHCWMSNTVNFKD